MGALPPRQPMRPLAGACMRASVVEHGCVCRFTSRPSARRRADGLVWSADWRCRFLGSSWRPCAIRSQHCTPDRQPRATLAATGCRTAQHDAAATPGLHNHQRTCGCNQGRNGQQPAATAARRPSHDMQSRWRCPCPGEWESVARGRRLVTAAGFNCTQAHTARAACTACKRAKQMATRDSRVIPEPSTGRAQPLGLCFGGSDGPRRIQGGENEPWGHCHPDSPWGPWQVRVCVPV